MPPLTSVSFLDYQQGLKLKYLSKMLTVRSSQNYSELKKPYECEAFLILLYIHKDKSLVFCIVAIHY